MRICSFLPSATEIIAELGLIDSLVGVSDECHWPPEVVGKPVVTATRVDPASMSSVAIDEAVRAAVREGRSLYAVDAGLLDSLDPDLIVTQDLCEVCAVSSGELASACPVGAEILSLDPHSLGEVADSVRLLGTVLGAEQRAAEIVGRMQGTIERTAASVTGRARRRVFLAEWLEPPFSAGHWVPEMVRLAGGVDVLGQEREASRRTSWETVLELDPELVILAPCGFDAGEAAARAAGLTLPCRAVAVDGDAYYSRPAPRLADGVRQLAHLFHPEAVMDPRLPPFELPAAAAAAPSLQS